MRDYAECFEDAVPTYSIQPRAAYSAPLSHLRSLLGDKAVWSFRGEPEPDLLSILEQRFGQFSTAGDPASGGADGDSLR